MRCKMCNILIADGRGDLCPPRQDEFENYDPEREQEKEDERMAECHCGAFQWSQKQGKFVQIADCVC